MNESSRRPVIGTDEMAIYIKVLASP